MNMLLFSRCVVVLLITFSTAQIISAQNAGELDPTFGTDGITDIDLGDGVNYCRSVVIQDDQKLVLFGKAEIDGAYRPTLVRLNTDGSLDESFGNNAIAVSDLLFEGFPHEEARSLVIQPDGKMVCVYCTDFDESSYTLTRFNADGSIDTDFGTAGSIETAPCSFFNRPRSILLQEDGSILVVGIGRNFANDLAKWTVVRYTAAGDVDITLDGDGTWIWAPSENTAGAYDAVEQPDGKILIAGNAYYLNENEFNEPRCVLNRLNMDGSYDDTFAEAGIGIYDVSEFGASPMAVALQADGSILMAGSVSTIDTGLDALLMRVTPDGALDASFGNGGWVTSNLPATDRAQSMLVMQDGNIMLGGLYYGTGAMIPGLLIKYSADGVQDMNFGNEEGYSTTQNNGYYGEEIIQQADGKIVLAGRNIQGNIRYFSASRFLIDDANAVHENGGSTSAFSLYPNPTSDQLFIRFSNGAPKNISHISIADINGKIIWQSQSTPLNLTQIDTSQFSDGVYSISIRSKKRNYTSKFVMAR